MVTATKPKPKKKPAKAKKPRGAAAIETVEDPKSLSQLQAEHYAEIQDKEKDCARLESEMMDLAEQYKEKKQSFKAADSSLRAIIRRGPDAQLKLPLKSQDSDKPAQPGEEVWRPADIGELGLTKAIETKLRDAGINTMGNLSDYTTPKGNGYCQRLTDIKGLGEGAIEKIEEATSAYWAKFANPVAESNGHAKEDKPEIEKDIESGEVG